jgi:hypothetical protein
VSKSAEGITLIYVSGHGTPPPRLGAVSEADFNRVRNLVVRVCSRHGTVGPSGKVPAVPSETVSAEDPDFYVVDDQYGDDRRILVEPRPSAMSAEWIGDLAGALRDLPNWDVLVSPGEGISLLIRDGTIEVAGWASRSEDLRKLVEETRAEIQIRVADRTGEKKRREAQVGQLVSAAWRLSQGKGLGFVAAFRSRSDGTPGDSVWILHFEDQSVFELDDYSFEPDALRPSLYWVGRSGGMTPYAPSSRPSGPEMALLAEWVLVTDGKTVTGANRLRVSKGGRTWQFDLFSH